MKELDRRNTLLDRLLVRNPSLASHLELTTLHVGDVVGRRKEPVGYVYFPLSCIFSWMVVLEGKSTSIGTAGNEGMSGFALALGADTIVADIVTQTSGLAYRLRPEHFADLLDVDIAGRKAVDRFVLAFLFQVVQSVACSRLHQAVPRCARWLLTATDQAGSDQIEITHELLASMLGLTRSTVSLACKRLQLDGWIDYSRGRLRVIDREGLEQSSCACYDLIRSAYREYLTP